MYWNFTNEELLKACKNKNRMKKSLGSWKKKYRQISHRAMRMGNKIEYLEELLDTISGFNLVENGIVIVEAMSREEPKELETGSDIKRGVDVYLNAHNSTTWGIQFIKHAEEGDKQIFNGADWTKEEVMEMAIKWLTKGRRPRNIGGWL